MRIALIALFLTGCSPMWKVESNYYKAQVEILREWVDTCCCEQDMTELRGKK